jgi:hypothetical protein
MFVQQPPSNVMAISSMITFFCSNLDRCKNLETAKMDVLGKEIDFVNLRSEIYVGSSHIPTMVCTCLTGAPH